jgi:hypothetical protein
MEALLYGLELLFQVYSFLRRWLEVMWDLCGRGVRWTSSLS